MKARRHIAYSLAASAATASVGSGSSDAAVIYSGIQDLAIQRGGSQQLRIDYDEYNDITLRNRVYLSVNNYQGITVNFAPGRIVGFSASGRPYVSALQEGALIDASTTSTDEFYGVLSYGNLRPQAQFTAINNAYFGFSFPINDVLHYAWMRVSINNAMSRFVAHAWAYESQPGVGIRAGDLPLPGDYNSSNVVDAADYTVWRDALGSTTDLRADGDEEGASHLIIDEADYLRWKATFGNTAGAGAGAAGIAAPEPMSLGLLAAGSLGLGLLRRCRGGGR
jgi:hypothetical protein